LPVAPSPSSSLLSSPIAIARYCKSHILT
jgi:hypothetical protein